MPKLSESIRVRESARILEAVTGAGDEKVFRVVLITEGLGNRRNMNYYGPEAIKSGVKAFEGKWCYLNHQSIFGEKNLPERDVKDKAGYYKNLKETKIDGVSAVVGELHCDLSESGRILADKLASALHYKKEFPNTDLEYCGLSVNGDGDAERRTIEVDGEEAEVNYVTEFTEGDSCDLVTTPARGGRGLAVIKEDAHGAIVLLTENENMKILESLRKLLAKLAESKKVAEGETKKKLSESEKELSGLIKIIEDMGGGDDVSAMFAKRESESDEDYKSRLGKMAEALKSAMGEGHHEAEQCPHGGNPADCEKCHAPAPIESARPKVVPAEDLERNTLAVKSFMESAGVPQDAYAPAKIERLARMSFREAKAVIEDDAKLAESVAKTIEAPVASLRGGVRESRGGNRASAFKESFSKEVI